MPEIVFFWNRLFALPDKRVCVGIFIISITIIVCD